MKLASVLFLTLAFFCLAGESLASGDDHEEHEGHEEHGEFHGGAYSIDEEATVLSVTVEKEHDEEGSHNHRLLSGEEDHEHIQILVNLVSGACDEETFEELEEEAEEIFENVTANYNGTVEEFEHNDIKVLVPGQREIFELEASEFLGVSMFHFNITDVPSCLYLFPGEEAHGLLEHLVNSEGEHVEPLFGHEEEEYELEPASAQIWLESIGATLVTALCSLIGVSLIPYWMKQYKGPESWFSTISGNVLAYRAKDFDLAMRRILCFGVGTLTTAVITHMLPEAYILIEYSEESETMETEYHGHVCFLGGIFLALLIDMAVTGMYGTDHRGILDQTFDESKNSTSNILTEKENLADEAELKKGMLGNVSPTAYNIIIGDAFHNISDGLLIAAAFLGCNRTLGWTVTVAIMCHELPQEFVDFVILLQSGLSIKAALFFNFLSSCSALLGVIILLSLSSVSQLAQGMLIAFGSGMLIFIALSEMLPIAFKVPVNAAKYERFLRLFMFILGCVLIGLTNLFHPHCEAGHNHGHEGHDH